MNPGRELDKEIAEKVFGLKVERIKAFGNPDWHYKNDDGSFTVVPQYSKHIASAWPIAQRFGMTVFATGQQGKAFARVEGRSIHEQGDSEPHAICLAALRAKDAGL